MIEHESDLWPERRWAVSTLWSSQSPQAFVFVNEEARDIWVSLEPINRRPVGKRHPAVKRLRQQWRQEALRKLATWKEQHS